ncbi:hypothetical protein JD844_020046 [Phrynosoma platyrhinos]|uniref:Uncharacterized protein n=1 Tax=Phrynosoma platyrhinos TaxID=52577 RepID=A0ABQ7TQW7_PHRPL|nr:hypothetical protein JD844_020046 [Phrynosoma platyrhinos]
MKWLALRLLGGAELLESSQGTVPIILTLNPLLDHCNISPKQTVQPNQRLSFSIPSSFTEAMKSQPKLKLLDCLLGYYVGMALIAVGSIFVISSFLALGFFGTFLGKLESNLL